jgi:hypothetical protein
MSKSKRSSDVTVRALEAQLAQAQANLEEERRRRELAEASVRL